MQLMGVNITWMQNKGRKIQIIKQNTVKYFRALGEIIVFQEKINQEKVNKMIIYSKPKNVKFYV